MRKTLTMLGSLLLAAPVMAQAPSTSQPQPGASSSQGQGQSNWEAQGKIVKVDDDELKISRPGAAQVEFDLRKDTKVRIGGREANASELKPGTEVRVRFDLDEDDTIAKEIEAR